MSAERIRKWAALLLGTAVLTTGCATVSSPPGRNASQTYSSRAAPGPALAGEVRRDSQHAVTGPNESVRLYRRRGERVLGTEVAMVSPGEIAVRAVTGGAVNMDAFESLLLLAGLDNVDDNPPCEAIPSEEIIKDGTRLSRPGERIQTFQMKIKINGRRELVQVVVDSDDANRGITMFPVTGGG